MRAYSLFFASIILPAAAPAQELDRLFFSLETVAHYPGGLDPIDLETEKLPLGSLRPVLHEAGFVYGIGVTQLGSEILMRAGYRFASGKFPEGSAIGSDAFTRYALAGVPLTIGWRMTFLPTAVRPLLGVDGGGAFARMRYEVSGGNPIESDWLWTWELRGIAGVHFDVWEWLIARLFVEGRYATGVFMEKGPEYSATGLGIGLAIGASFDRPAPDTLAAKPADRREDDTKPELREYGRLGKSRLDRAFELITLGDEAVRRRDFIEAETHYRRAIGIVPQDDETRRNVEVPVRIDWAKTLIEIGRSAEARRVLDETLQIDPTNAKAAELRRRLGSPDG